MKNYGGHSAHLLFHVIVSELQCIILDSHKKYYLGAFIYWACLFILGTFICSGCIYLFWVHLFILGMFICSVCLCTLTPTHQHHPWPPMATSWPMPLDLSNHHIPRYFPIHHPSCPAYCSCSSITFGDDFDLHSPLLPLLQYWRPWWITWMCSTHCITDAWHIAGTCSWHFLRAY